MTTPLTNLYPSATTRGADLSALKENLRHIADKKRQAERKLQQADNDETGPDALA